MKFLIFAITIIAIVGVLLFAFFSGEVKIQIIRSLFGMITSIPTSSPMISGKNMNDARNPPPASATPKFVPPGFRGPTGEPHVVGPSGPPPNY